MNGVATPLAALFAASFVLSWFGVGVFRRWSLRREFLDVPNERSSHSIPTPRGGGLIIFIACIAGYIVISLVLGIAISWGYIVASVLVAGISWIDDLRSLPFWERLIVHVAAALILIYDLGSWNIVSIPLTNASLPLGRVLGAAVTVGWIVWFLNAYNFMDGIDGIAALQAVITGIAWAVLAWMWHLPGLLALGGLVASASAGFLIHNWQPAKIFMGDVGSAFLGFTLAAMPLLAQHELRYSNPALPSIGVLFVWLFVFDTIFTFLRRLIKGERVWEAHRNHVYQKLVIEGRTHAGVTILYGLASILLCLVVLVDVFLSGIYPALAFFSFVGLTVILVYLGVRKNVDLNN